MEKDEILERSRRENRNKDLAELAVSAQAGNIAWRVGACVCCLVSLLTHMIADIFPYSPWMIYFSILGTHNLVKYIKLRRKGDLSLSVLYLLMCVLAFVAFLLRLVGAVG